MRFRTSFLALCLGCTLAAPASAADTPPPVDTPRTSLARYTGAAQDLVIAGLGYLGIPYRYGGTSPETGLDCSGLVQNVFRNALGMDMPRTAAQMARVGDRVPKSELKPGDLVFFNTMRRAFSHVGIYIGDNQFVHAPSGGGEVRVESLSQGYWTKRFNGARRVAPDTPGLSSLN